MTCPAEGDSGSANAAWQPPAGLGDVLLLPHGVNANIYVRELARAYRGLGVSVVLGADNLAEIDRPPRWLHLHWPEEHYRWTGQGAMAARAQAFADKLHWLKSAGTRIAWTVHNLAPHEHVGDPVDKSAYRAVIQAADLLVHHCRRSVGLLEETYPEAKGKPSVVCPHGHFLAYPRGASRSESRRRLGISDGAVVFLHFGQVRAYKGMRLLLNAFARLRLGNKHLLVAGRYAALAEQRTLSDRLRLVWLERFSRRATMHFREISNEEVQYYMAAADAVVLTHRSGLNSGVAVLGMSFGKPVIAPDVGCIPEVLAEGVNFVYRAGDERQLITAMESAARADGPEIERRNTQAASRWRWDDMARSVLEGLAVGSIGGR